MLKLKNKYFLLRHGETTHQIEKKDFSYSSLENEIARLTKEGENQIKSAAKKLKKEKIDLIFSSDFFRTRQTAGIVAQTLSLKVKFDPRLRDLNLGIYQGRPKTEYYLDFPKYSKKRFIKNRTSEGSEGEDENEVLIARPQGGESWRDLQKRTLNFLKKIDNKYQGKTILIVSHGDPLWLMEGVAKGLKPEELLSRRRRDKSYPRLGQLKELL